MATEVHRMNRCKLNFKTCFLHVKEKSRALTKTSG